MKDAVDKYFRIDYGLLFLLRWEIRIYVVSIDVWIADGVLKVGYEVRDIRVWFLVYKVIICRIWVICFFLFNVKLMW